LLFGLKEASYFKTCHNTSANVLMCCSPCILPKLVDSNKLDALNFSNLFITTCFGHYVPIIRRDPIALTQLLYLSFREKSLVPIKMLYKLNSDTTIIM
jgi:hypothetical protein